MPSTLPARNSLVSQPPAMKSTHSIKVGFMIHGYLQTSHGNSKRAFFWIFGSIRSRSDYPQLTTHSRKRMLRQSVIELLVIKRPTLDRNELIIIVPFACAI